MKSNYLMSLDDFYPHLVQMLHKYLLLFLCIFSLVLPTGCEVKEQKQVVVDYQEYHFRNENLLESHYEKHGKDMGFVSSEEYEMAASDVVNNPKSLHKTEKEDGDDVYYKEDTNEFVVVSTDGYIRTYFNPDSGKKYFDRQ